MSSCREKAKKEAKASKTHRHSAVQASSAGATRNRRTGLAQRAILCGWHAARVVVTRRPGESVALGGARVAERVADMTLRRLWRGRLTKD